MADTMAQAKKRQSVVAASRPLKIFIIAGEVSGDVLGAKIMREMPTTEFVGVGGENMAAAGLKTIFPISDIAVMGIAEVAAHARTVDQHRNPWILYGKHFLKLSQGRFIRQVNHDNPGFDPQGVRQFFKRLLSACKKPDFIRSAQTLIQLYGKLHPHPGGSARNDSDIHMHLMIPKFLRRMPVLWAFSYAKLSTSKSAC